jgi:branched-chain amino acid transport system substrate-binding protein
LFAVLSVAAIAFDANAGFAAETVKIGVLMPLTGNAAAAGQAAKAAIEVAADIVNNPHPELSNLPLATTAGLPHLGGAKVEVVFVDHQGNPSQAQQLATRLITEDKVSALMGAYQSSCTFTATPVAERYGIPCMVGDSAALNITTRIQICVPGDADRDRLRSHLYALLRRHEEGGQGDQFDRDRQ